MFFLCIYSIQYTKTEQPKRQKEVNSIKVEMFESCIVHFSIFHTESTTLQMHLNFLFKCIAEYEGPITIF